FNQKDSLMQLAKENYQKATNNYQKAQKIQIEINDIKGFVITETNLGAFYISSKDYPKALEQLDDALEKVKEIDSPPYLTSIILYYRSQTNLFLQEPEKALADINQSLKIAKESNIKKTLSEDYNLLTDVYDFLGRYKEALYAHRQYGILKDSIFSEKTNKLSQEFGKRENERQLELKESQIKQQEIENKQQRLFLYGLGIIIIFIVVFIFLIFRQYRQKKRANEVLEAKNLLITQQKQEITDSIQYAQYIQLAVLPQLTSVSTMMVDHFILFRPRDIVSGDFYWMKELTASNSLMITAADCTGHGVPGAFMSLLGISFLNEITSYRELNSPGLILDQLKQKVIESLHQTEEVGSSHDGMDMSFVIINKNEKHVKYAGANNPLYIIRSNEMPPVESDKMLQGETHTLYEIKADKMPIGISHASDAKFTTHTINYLEGDTIYLFSDGYADQFGGEKYKKLKYMPFKKILLENINLSMDKQKQEIEELHLQWKGDREQTDDIIVIGIRL
ncbi:MAG: SpoIIE family protein phosphatase, partial [Bacteroidales bacterium]|nr:SpoIIE family protein phosphatase [Bacteroidales bacterium]